MDSRSPYLAQAIQAMSQPMAEPASQGPSLSQMAQAVKQRQAWETANPGQSYMMHGIRQAGQNVADTPQRIAGLLGLGQSPAAGQQPLPNAAFDPNAPPVPGAPPQMPNAQPYGIPGAQMPLQNPRFQAP